MIYYIAESGSAERSFDNLTNFIEALKDLASTYESEGKETFEIEVASD